MQLYFQVWFQNRRNRFRREQKTSSTSAAASKKITAQSSKPRSRLQKGHNGQDHFYHHIQNGYGYAASPLTYQGMAAMSPYRQFLYVQQ